MNRFLKAFGLIALITFFASCKKDDDGSVAPPRPYGEQYIKDNDSIEKYLKNHYLTVDNDFNVDIQPIATGGTQTSIWDQQTYPLKFKTVTSNDVVYKVYYLSVYDGDGEAPTRGDNVLIAYRGLTLHDVQFDYQPFPQTAASLTGVIEGWQEIIPLFKTGKYIDIPDNPDPAKFEGYGVGVMFLPSGLAYYNNPTSSLISAYDPLVFTFKLYGLEYTDLDGDGLLNKDETEPGIDIKDYDTDGDEIPNYLDTDDDGDGYPTKYELRKYIAGTSPLQPQVPEAYYTVEDGNIPVCTDKPIHIDPMCFPK